MPKKYKVLTPNKHFTGSRNGVNFVEGKGEATKQEALELMRTWGYSCPDLEDKKEETKEPEANGSRAIEPWQDAVEAVKELESKEDIETFITDEDRKSVLKAANERVKELEEKAAADKKDSDDKSDKKTSASVDLNVADKTKGSDEKE